MSKFLVLLIVLSNWSEESLATILRGARAKSGQFPWLIQFQTVVPCGGVLVSPDWVLTAAQCVQYNRNSITLYAAGLNGTGSGQTVGVKATYIFPKYRSYSTIPDHEHNVALLKLVEPFHMCDKRVRLLDTAAVRLDEDYKTCLIFGWQSYVSPSTKVLAKPIRYSHVILNSWKLCVYMLKGNISYTNVFCTMIEHDNGIKACAGNPGSPVVCEDQHRRMILLGVASWSNFSLDCEGIPTYLGVSVFRSWMNDLIFSDKENRDWDSDLEYKSRVPCGPHRNRESLASGISPWNYSNDEPLLSDFREDKTLQDSRLKTNNLYRVNNYDVIPVDIVREREDNLKQYHEVGPWTEVSVAREASPSKTEDAMSKSVNKESKTDSEPLDDDLNELEFAIPLDEDYFMAGSCSVHFCVNLGPMIIVASFYVCNLIIH